MQGRVRRVESLLCFDRRLTDKTFSPVISGIMKDRSRGGTTTRVCCILCVVGFVYLCLYDFFKNIYSKTKRAAYGADILKLHRHSPDMKSFSKGHHNYAA